MKETGIIMSGNHPKLILDGIKTQTRRVIKPQPRGERQAIMVASNGTFLYEDWDGSSGIQKLAKYQVGDRLWVRETWAKPIERYADVKGAFVYKAGYEKSMGEQFFGIPFKWKPSIHMPRWASRITLEITDIRVERVGEISNEDARAEGLTMLAGLTGGGYLGLANERYAFKDLWDSLNAKRGYGWESNPWVWVISFKVVK